MEVRCAGPERLCAAARAAIAGGGATAAGLWDCLGGAGAGGAAYLVIGGRAVGSRAAAVAYGPLAAGGVSVRVMCRLAGGNGKRRTKKEKAGAAKSKSAAKKAGSRYELVHDEFSGVFSGSTPLAAAKKAYKANRKYALPFVVLRALFGDGEEHEFAASELEIDSSRAHKRGRGGRDRTGAADRDECL